MSQLKMYCLSINIFHLKLVAKSRYLPVGLGNSNFNSSWKRENKLNNVFYQNSYYDEYTFSYVKFI